MPSLELLSHFVLAGLISIMKLINWAMGDFYMIGSFVQFMVVSFLVGNGFWYVGLPISMAAVFVLGVLIQRFLIKPMFDGGIERRTEPY